MSRPLFAFSSLVPDGDFVPVSSVLALDTAGRLDRELATVTGYLNDAAGPFSPKARSAFLLQSLATVVVTARLLRQQLLDVMCRTTEGALDIHERVIRARANIVMRTLNVLTQREHEVPTSALVGRFRRVHDVRAFLIDEVTNIYTKWSEQCGMVRQLDQSTHYALRYIAVDEAEIAFERLGRDVAFATFLRVGTADGSDAVRTACREIAAIVGLAPAIRDDDEANHLPGSDEECVS